MFDMMSQSDSDFTDNLSAFDSPQARVAIRSDKDLQRADGSGRVVLRGSKEGNRIVYLFQRTPIRIMFPRGGAGAIEEAVFINTGGGIAGGDRLESRVTAL